MAAPRSSFVRQFSLSYLVLFVATFLLAGLYLNQKLKNDYLNELRQSLTLQLEWLTPVLGPSLMKHALNREALLDTLRTMEAQSGYRFTLIQANGTVLADSEKTLTQLADMGNHLDRPEIQAALHEPVGHARRYSHSVHREMLYVAKAIRAPELQGWIRVALPLTHLSLKFRKIFQDLLLVVLVSLIVGLLLAWGSVRRVSLPLEQLIQAAHDIGEGRPPSIALPSGRDEFGQLGRTLTRMSKQIEETVSILREQQGRLNAILASLVESVIAIDAKGAVLFVNPAAEELFDVRSETIQHRPILEVLRYSALHDIVSSVLQSRQSLEQEVTLPTPRERTVAIHAIPVEYASGDVGAVLALHDRTEIRRLERLRQDFVANVTHELKTPLTSIQGFVETLLMGAINDPSCNREFLETIQSQARRLSLLIDDILNLAAIESKRIPLRFDVVNVHEIVEQIFRSLEPQAKTKKVVLENRLANGQTVWSDREKLAQVLLNLIDNAIKYNHDGGTVILSGVVRDSALEISVSDNGPGIPAADRARVFERFFRVDKSHNQTIPGTGLGLAIVKHLIESLQGKVWLESEEGHGTRFTCAVPLKDLDHPS